MAGSKISVPPVGTTRMALGVGSSETHPRSLPGRGEPQSRITPESTRVLIVTEVRLFREGLARVLSAHASGLVLDTATADDELISRIVTFGPDVILVDAASLLVGHVARSLREAQVRARLVAFAVAEEENEVVNCAEAGATGLVVRDASVEELVAAVDAAMRGELRCSPRAASFICARLAAVTHPTAARAPGLTGREKQVLTLIDDGFSNKEIASRLSIEVSTVKNHVHSILEKLHVRHRWEAAGFGRPVMGRSRPGS